MMTSCLEDNIKNLENSIKKLAMACIAHPVAIKAMPIVTSSTPYGAEELIVKKAVDKRRNEFFCGRHLLRSLLSTYNFPNCAILRGQLGQPLLPDAFIGSISHDESTVAGILIPKGLSIQAVGIDLIGPSSRIGENLMPSISSMEEMNGLFAKEVACPLRIIFSIKESVVKILSPLLQKYIDLQDIMLAHNDQQIIATYRHKPEWVMRTNWAETEGFIVSLAVLT